MTSNPTNVIITNDGTIGFEWDNRKSNYVFYVPNSQNPTLSDLEFFQKLWELFRNRTKTYAEFIENITPFYLEGNGPKVGWSVTLPLGGKGTHWVAYNGDAERRFRKYDYVRCMERIGTIHEIGRVDKIYIGRFSAKYELTDLTKEQNPIDHKFWDSRLDAVTLEEVYEHREKINLHNKGVYNFK
jgi:hypothetical protein